MYQDNRNCISGKLQSLRLHLLHTYTKRLKIAAQCVASLSLSRLVMAGLFATLPATMFAQSETQTQQNAIVIAPLFEYPEAPEDMDNLADRCNYLVDNFWSQMDFKSKSAVDQNALNDAFQRYTAAMAFADRTRALASINNVTAKLKGNPTLTLQFARAAEDMLYGDRAYIWSDEAYLPFIKAVVSEKGLSEARKARYADQLKRLTLSAVGKKAPTFRYRNRDGHYRDLDPDTEFTLIEFGSPDCDDCRFSRLKLELAGDLADLITQKRLRILFMAVDVDPDEERETLEMLQDYPANWIAGVAYGVEDNYDIRHTPSFYILDAKGRILQKNIEVVKAVDTLRSLTADRK